jgi:hypothetical protein
MHRGKRSALAIGEERHVPRRGAGAGHQPGDEGTVQPATQDPLAHVPARAAAAEDQGYIPSLRSGQACRRTSNWPGVLPAREGIVPVVGHIVAGKIAHSVLLALLAEEQKSPATPTGLFVYRRRECWISLHVQPPSKFEALS